MEENPHFGVELEGGGSERDLLAAGRYGRHPEELESAFGVAQEKPRFGRVETRRPSGWRARKQGGGLFRRAAGEGESPRRTDLFGALRTAALNSFWSTASKRSAARSGASGQAAARANRRRRAPASVEATRACASARSMAARGPRGSRLSQD